MWCGKQGLGVIQGMGREPRKCREPLDADKTRKRVLPEAFRKNAALMPP